MKKKIKKTAVKKSTKKVAAKKPSAKKSVTKVAPANKSGIQPLGDRVLVAPANEGSERMLASGIIIPDTAGKEKPEQGIVIAVGDGKRTEDGTLVPVSVSVGDRVLFSKYGFDEVKVNGVEYFIIGESNILAVLS